MAAKVFIMFAAVVALGVALPVENNLPVLKELQPELLFRTSADGAHPFVLECATTKPNEKVQYTWEKNGKPLDGKDLTDITFRAHEGTLIFKKPKETDEGRYRCIATSTEGVARSRVVDVKRTFVEIPPHTLKKHRPVEGRPFKMDCSVPKAYPQPKIEWFRQGKDGQFVDIMEKRLLESPEGTLYFTNVTQQDVDKDLKYVCLVETPASDEKLVAAEHVIEDLTLTKEPQTGELTPQYLSKDTTAKTGDVTKLYCIYGGTPMAHPSWYKLGPSDSRQNVNGKPGDRVTHRNRSGGRRLLISKTLAEDDATYECVADNGAGQPQTHRIKLTVEKSAEFVKKPKPVETVAPGADVNIDCEVTGVDSISWTFNGQPLTGKSNSNKSLNLSKVQKKDNGYYGCTGANKLGEVYAETLLHVA